MQRIFVGGFQVGISGLEEIFQSWLAEGKSPQELAQEKVLEAVRKHNYVVPRLEGEYSEAIKAKYAAYCQNLRRQ